MKKNNVVNQKIPRNNNKNISCHKCNQKIKIINGDIKLSLNRHLQLHKQAVDQDFISREFSRANLGSDERRNEQQSYGCPECKEIIPIFNNDVRRSLELHAQTHQRSTVGSRGDDQSSTSSGRSRESSRRQNNVNNSTNTRVEQMSVLDKTFNQMPLGLKAHRGFVMENEFEEVICCVCDIRIDSLYKIEDHLKTKSHEDNTISFIKSKLPRDLCDTMEFVSIYGSNLCCNLCGCKIDLCSLNISETIVNIISHNAGRLHLNKRGTHDSSDQSQEGMKIVNFLASMDNLISNNKHLIQYEMQPQFKCKLCDKLIAFDKNEKILVKNFGLHFTSNAHNKCAKATTVLSSFKRTYKPTDRKHDLKVTKGNITCTICKASFEPTIEKLEEHVRVSKNISNIEWPQDLASRISIADFRGYINQNQNLNPFLSNNKDQTKMENAFSINTQARYERNSKLTLLLNTMPPKFRNINYVVESSESNVTCLICNCVIPATHQNLISHLMGANHAKNEGSLLDSNVEKDSILSNSNPNPSVSQAHNFNPFMKENASPSTSSTKNELKKHSDVDEHNFLMEDPLIRKNRLMLTKVNDNLYVCNLCKLSFKKPQDLESLKKNLIVHFSGQKHLQNFSDRENTELKNLFECDPLVRDNRNYILKRGDFLLCTLCDIKLAFSNDEIKLKYSLTEHLKGQKHLMKVSGTANQLVNSPNKSTNPLEQLAPSKANEEVGFFHSNTSSYVCENSDESYKRPNNLIKLEDLASRLQKQPNILSSTHAHQKEQLQTQDGKSSNIAVPSTPNLVTNPFKVEDLSSKESKSSKLFPDSNEIAKELKDLNVEELTSNAVKLPNSFKSSAENFKELQHKKITEETNVNTSIFKPTSTYSNTNEEVKKQQQSSKEELFAVSTTANIPSIVNSSSIQELFQKMPSQLQGEIAFIENSSAIKGYLSCTLCKSGIINPHYLQKHLEDIVHLKAKVAYRSVQQGDSQTAATSSQKIMRNMKSFFGISK